MTLERYFGELTDEAKPVKHAGLVLFSSLNAEEAEVARRLWRQLPVKRRRQVVATLLEMAEDNIELDFTAFFKLCLKDPDEEVRGQAIEGLWESEERGLIPIFIGLLREDPSEQVRATAAVALGKFAELAQDGKLLDRDGQRVFDVLMGTICSSSQPLEVRRRAMEAVAAFGHPEVEQVISQAYSGAEPLLRRSALFAMGRNCHPRWRSLVVKELSSSDAAMRFEAANACAEMGDESLVPHLLPLLRDEMQVRLAAVQALRAIGGSLAKKSLALCLKSPDEVLREAAQEALDEIRANEEPLAFQFPS